MTIRYILFLVVASATVALLPTAAEANTDFNISGFGTFGYAATDKEDTVYLTGDAVDGADDSGSYKIDTRLGVQFDTTLDTTTSATLQVQSRQTYNGDFQPRLSWAFVKNQVSDSLVFRFGRLNVPFFMISEFREVGYANISLRPPEDTYKQAPLGSVDGLDLTGYFDWGDTEITAQTFVGFRDKEGREDIKISLRDSIGANIAFERGPARLRFSAIRTRLGIANVPGSDQIQLAASFVPELAGVATDFNGLRKKATFLGASLELDLDPWNFAAEYTVRDIGKTYYKNFNAWYVTAAYRWRNFTPYFTVSQLTQTSKTEVDFPSGTLAEAARGPIDAIYVADDQTSAILGLRWDFLAGAALKFQAENIARKHIGASFSQPEDAPTGKGADVKLFSIAVDFTF